MKLFATTACAVLLAAGPAAAQLMYTPVPPPPMPPPSVYPAPAPPLWTYDDGSTSDYPTHTPSDFVADQLNRQELIASGAAGYPPPAYWPPPR